MKPNTLEADLTDALAALREARRALYTAACMVAKDSDAGGSSGDDDKTTVFYDGQRTGELSILAQEIDHIATLVRRFRKDARASATR